MPTVPRYQEGNVKEAGLNLGRVESRVSSDAFGAGYAGTFSNAINEADKIVTQYQDHADQIALMEADQKATELETRLLYDPQNGALNKRGKDSFDLPNTVNEDLNKGFEEITSSMNERQKQKFNRIAYEKQARINRSLDQHISGEMKRYDDSQTMSYINTKQNAALTEYQNPEAVNRHIEDQKLAIAAYGGRNGMPSLEIKEKMDLAASKTHHSVLERLVDTDNDLAAKAHFEANKDKLVGEDLVRAEKLVEASSLRGESQRRSDEIFKTFRSEKDAIEEAKKIQEPKLRDETVRRTREAFELKRLAEENDRKELNRQAQEMTLKGKELPESMKQKMSISDVAHIDTYKKNVREGKFITTDFATYYDLRTLASNPETRNQFLRTDLNDPKLLNKLDDGARVELVKLQDGMRKGDKNTQKELDGFRSDQAIVQGGIKSLKIDKDPVKADLFARRVQEKLVDFEARNGKKAKSDEVQAIVDEMKVQHVVEKGWLWDSKKSAFELTDEERARAEVKAIADIPEKRRKDIEVALRTKGKPVTEESILRLYNYSNKK